MQKAATHNTPSYRFKTGTIVSYQLPGSGASVVGSMGVVVFSGSVVGRTESEIICLLF